MTEHSKYDIWGYGTRRDPHSLYRRMRQEDPTFRVIDGMGQTVWFFTRYEDSVAMLKDRRVIKDIQKNLPPEVLEARFGGLGSASEQQQMFDAINRHMLNQDPPDHTRLRGLVHKAFTPARVRDLEPRIAQITNDLLDAMQDKAEGDLIADFALPLPITVIAEMLGIPVADRGRFRSWTREILSFGPESSIASIMEFVQYMNEMIEARRARDTGDILSALVRVEDEGTTLDHIELLSMIFLLLVAGHETTVNLIANGTLALLQHPDQMRKLQDDPALIASAVEEMLRYNGPIDATLNRWAAEPIEWHDGRVIEPGDVIIPLLLAANRDPAVFDNPDSFDISRDPNSHIAFGHGIHFCLGAPLARMEAKTALGALVTRLPNLALNIDPAQIVWGPSIVLHNMLELPLTYQ